MDLITKEDGGALVEVALILPILLVLFLSGVDYALYLQRSIVVTDAATIGARYGTIAGKGSDLTGMQNVAKLAAREVPGFTAVASSYCSCSAGGSVTSCTSACSGQATPVQYVKVLTSASVPVFFATAHIPATMQLSGSAIMRVAYGQ